MLKVNREVLAACAMLASDEPSRYALTGVHVKDFGKGKGAAYGTDGKYLIRARWNDAPAKDCPAALALAGKNGGEAAILDRDAIAETLKRLPRAAKGADSRIALAIGKEVGAHVSGNDGIPLPVRTVEGSFPNSDDVFPAREKADYMIDAVRMRDALDALLKAHGSPDFLAVNVYHGDRLSAVTLEAKVRRPEPGKPNLHRGGNPDIEVDALVMPLTEA